MKRDDGMTMMVLSRCAAEDAVFVTCCTGLKFIAAVGFSCASNRRLFLKFLSCTAGS